MAQKPKKDTSKSQQDSFSKGQDNKKEKMIKLGVILAFLVVLIILLVTFCHRKDYAVTFMVDGKEYRLENVRNMGEIVKPKEPTKEGYTFTGWYVGDKEFDFETGEITADMQLEAHFAKNTYSITIDDGVNAPTEIEVEHGEKLKEPEVPTKDGYTFLGWYVGKDTFDFSNEITESAQIEARWAEIGNASYTVEHYLMGLDGKYNKPDKTEHKMGRIGSKVTPTTHTYEGFTAPTKETVTVLEDGETTVKYYYKRNKYNLTLKGDNGVESLNGEGSYYYKEKVNVEVTPKEGYAFAYWSNKQVNAAFTYTIYNNITLTATTTPIEYTITYDLHGGMGDNPSTYTVENPIVLKDPTKEGYTFKHWLVNGKEVEDFDGLLGDLKIEAIFEANVNTPYTVEHYYMGTDGNYSNTPSSKEEKTGTTDTSILKEADRKVPEVGYEFDKEESTSSVIKGSGDSVVRYYYKRKKHTLTITGGKGVETPQSPSKESYLYGEAITLDSKNTTFEEGYEFSHWLLDGETKEDDTLTFEMKDADMTVEVGAKLTTYTLTYISKTNKEETLTDTFKMGDTLTAKEPTAWVGHHFDGWYSTPDFKEGTKYDFTKPMSAGNLTLYAKWIINHNTFTFESLNPNIPVEIEDIVQDFGTDIVKPQDPTYPGYTFDGWYDQTGTTKLEIPTTMPQEGMTFYAKWHANTYTVTFDSNGGEGDMKPQGFTYDEASRSLTRNSFTKPGYHFVGWSTTSDNQKKAYDDEDSVQNIAGKEKDKDSITLYAMWEANTYKVKYHGNTSTEGTDFEEEFTYDVEKELNKNESHFTKRGYHFLGWTSDTTTNTLITEKKNYTTGDVIDVYAVWEANTYTVTYDSNKGTGSSEPEGEVEKTTHTYDNTTDLSKSPYTREGYTFLGWSLTKQETSVDTCSDCLTEANNLTSDNDGNVTVYAVWKANTYTVTYDANDGTGKVEPTSHRYDTVSPLSSSRYERKGYTFLGWSQTKQEGSKDSCTDCIETANNLTASENGSVTVYAVWKMDTYTITYEDSKNGTLETENRNSYTVEDDTFTLNEPTKEGYTFKGWYKKGKQDKVESVVKGSTGNLELEARWETVSYNVTCVDKLSGTNTKQDYTVESGVTLLDPASKEGYTFEGWYENENFDGNKVSSYEVGTTGNKTVYAKWREHTYKVKYADKSGEETHKYTDQFTLKGESEYTKEWTVTYNYNDNNVTTSTEEKRSLSYKKWKVQGTDKSYDVNAKVSGLTSSDNETIILEPDWENPTISDSELKTPTRTGYTFVEWQLDGHGVTKNSVVDKNIELIAKWKANTYTAQFKYNNGTDASTSVTFTYGSKNKTLGADGISYTHMVTWTNEGSEVKQDILSATLTGWKLETEEDGTCYQPDTVIDAELATEQDATIIFVACWEEPTLTLPTEEVAKTGYKLDGWYNDNTKVNTGDKVTSNLNIATKWKPIQYKVKFVDGNGNTSSYIRTREYDKTERAIEAKQVGLSRIYTLTLNPDNSEEKVEEQYEAKFSKWKVLNGPEQGKVYTPSQYSKANLSTTDGEEITIEAQWEATEVNLDGKTKPSKEGYTFQGWLQDQSTVGNIISLTSDLELTASWKAITYTARYLNNQGETKNVKCTFDKDCSLPNADFNSNKSYTITFHLGDGSTQQITTSTSSGDVICRTTVGNACRKGSVINAEETGNTIVKNLTAKQSEIVIVSRGAEAQFPKVQDSKEDYVFGGWSTKENTENPEDILGYNPLGDQETFTGEYSYESKSWNFVQDTDLYEKWWDVPYIESVGFELNSMTTEEKLDSEVRTGRKTGEKKTALYVKIPETTAYYVNVFTLAVETTHPVKLNYHTIAANGDIYARDASGSKLPQYKSGISFGKVESVLGILPFITSNGGTRWRIPYDELSVLLGDDMQTFTGILMAMFTGQKFAQSLKGGFFLDGNNLGVAANFGCNGLACSPRYESILVEHLNGASYYFFGTEEALNEKYTIQYKVKEGEEETLLYSFEVPAGTPIPDLGKVVKTYDVQETTVTEKDTYNITKWTLENSDTEYDFEKNVAESTNPACNGKVITIVGRGTKVTE